MGLFVQCDALKIVVVISVYLEQKIYYKGLVEASGKLFFGHEH